MDYREYKTNVWFWIQTALISSGIGGLTGYLFFDAWWGSLLIPVCMPVVYSRLRRWHLERQTRQLKMEFQEVMTLISGCMHAGYSLENAIVQVRRTSGEEFSLMREELQILVNGIACHKRVEQLLLALAERCDVEEIRELAIMIEIAKHYGGNIPHLIRQITTRLQASEMTEVEIQTVIAAKRLEGHIMLIVPFGILMFLRLTNPVYMQVLYTTIAGRLCMSVSAFGIGGCAYWIDKIMRIEV